MITVTKAVSPPTEELLTMVAQIAESRFFTNNGMFVRKLEGQLSSTLNLPFVRLCSSGTMALQLAIRGLQLHGKKVFVTPFTYVATLSALLWEGCTPVFVDIDPEDLCLSPEKLRQAATAHPDAKGVLPVHIYGNACDIAAIDAIAQEFDLQVLYDASHAFGCEYNGTSLLGYGDCSVCSLHATKIFHTAEGGCIVSRSSNLNEDISLKRAFGHVDDTHHSLGINGKMSELHAAVGLANLPLYKDEIARRKVLAAQYDSLLTTSSLLCPTMRAGVTPNYAYYPLLLPTEKVLHEATTLMKAKDIYPRRYFYPSLNTLPYLPEEAKVSCPVAESSARRVLCLPLFGDMDPAYVDEISQILLRVS